MHQNCLIFAKVSDCDNRGRSNYQVTSTELPYFAKNSARDSRGSSNFLIPSTKLPYFCENFNSWWSNFQVIPLKRDHVKMISFFGEMFTARDNWGSANFKVTS